MSSKAESIVEEIAGGAPEDSSLPSALTPEEAHINDEPEKGDYFTKKESESHAVAADSATGETSLESDILSAEATKPGTPEPVSPDNVTSATKKVPGWKGWLRSASASSASNTSRPNSLIRKVTSTTPLPTVHDDSNPQTRSPLLSIFSAAKDSMVLSEREESEWNFYREIVQGEQLTDVPAVRAAVRAGFPEKIRGVLWQALTNSKSSELDRVFQELHNTNSGFDKQVKKDISRMPKVWHKAFEKKVETQ